MTRRAQPGQAIRSLPLPALVDALAGWQEHATDARRRKVTTALGTLAAQLGQGGLHLVVESPPLTPLDVGVGTLRRAPADRDPLPLRQPTDGTSLGRLWIDGPDGVEDQVIHAVELALEAVRGMVRAARAEANLAALDGAVAGIGGALSIDRVLQLIVDRVHELADARYAALAIVGEDGRVERFLTSGISAAARRRIGALPAGHGLLGLIIREQRPIRIPDIAVDPRRAGFPPNHPEMRSFLGVPLTVHGRSVGNLYLTDKRAAREFSEEDLLLVERFARHAALAIENARLGDRVQRLAIVEERERIGRDLHDGVIQHLYGISLSLDEVPEIVGDRPDEAAQRVDAAIDSLQHVMGEIREFVYGLAEPASAADGLAVGAEALADDVRANAGLIADVDVRGASGFGSEATAELLAILREALSNVARHASARRVTVRSRRRARDLVIEVVDDGIGFVPAPMGSGHHGLRNMERRTERLGGAFEVRSAKGRGTRIIITVPVAHDETGQGGSDRA